MQIFSFITKSLNLFIFDVRFVISKVTPPPPTHTHATTHPQTYPGSKPHAIILILIHFFFSILPTLLYPLFWIFVSWYQICNQQGQKLLNTWFFIHSLRLSDYDKFWTFGSIVHLFKIYMWIYITSQNK